MFLTMKLSGPGDEEAQLSFALVDGQIIESAALSCTMVVRCSGPVVLSLFTGNPVLMTGKSILKTH